MTRSKDELSTVHSEGALLPPDFLSLLLDRSPSLDGVSPDAYRKPGNRLDDVIAREWASLLGVFAAFKKKRETRPTSDLATALTRDAWLVPLFESLGFGQLSPLAEPIVLGERIFRVSHRWEHAPIHAVGYGVDLDKRTKGAPGAEAASPHALVQTLLNQHHGSLWGIVTNGKVLRLLRDNQSLSRQAFVDFDLEAIFEGQRFADFRLFWLVCHASRFHSPKPADQEPSDCWLEKWRQAAQTRGVQALDRLRDGVKKAIERLGNGFFRHPASAELQARLRDRKLTKEDFYRDLLRLVYRLIFVLVAEEREVLLSPDASPATRALYQAHYALGALRDRALRGRGGPHGDLWQRLRLVLFRLHDGCPELGLPALGSFLFRIGEGDWLRSVGLSNDDLLGAFQELCYVVEKGRLRRVRWQDVGADELGSVYEALLELQPRFEADGRTFMLGVVAGNERKTSGSYYTPSSLVDCLLDSALDPVIDQACRGKSVEEAKAALLDLKVCDPACGSGHFLVAAARRIARRYAEIETGEDEPSPQELRKALRLVVGRCIFGVDINPMAVELCKVGLWIEAMEPGLPLTFLDSHIQHGNALLGTTPELMTKGIPDAAWDPIEGDDKKAASALKKRNKKHGVEEQTAMAFVAPTTQDEAHFVMLAVAALDAASDANADALAKKELQWSDILGSPEYRHQKFVADAWCAAFMWPKQSGEFTNAAPTNELWRQIRDRQGQPPPLTTETVNKVAEQYRFFHWHLQFPQVFAKGGFDVVLGNPPWDTLSPDAKEFFSVYDPEIRFQSKDDQEKTISRLSKDIGIAAAWEQNRRNIFLTAFFLKESGRFSLFAPGNLGKGDFNLYRLFIELALRLVREHGFAAQVVPDGLYSGANSMAIRKALFENFRLSVLFGFENAKEVWFTGVDSRAKFSLYAAQKGEMTDAFSAAFWIRSLDALSAVREGNTLNLPVAMVREFSPDALAIMEFRGQRDINIARKMYARFPPLGQHIPGTAHRSFLRELESGHVQGLLTEDRTALPHYEGRMIAPYDHRAKGYRSGRARSAFWEDLHFGSSQKSIQPQWYVHANGVPEQAKLRIGEYRVGFCDVASPTNERTLVAAMLPQNCISGDKVPTVLMKSSWPSFDLLLWLAAANSFVMDFLVRMKVSLKMALTILDSLPFPRLQSESHVARSLVENALRLTCTGPEMNALWDEFVKPGIVPARKSGDAPGAINWAERLSLRANIEAHLAHLYGLSAEELGYVLDTFPIVQKDDEKAHGEYRTKRLILEIYDEMAKAVQTGKPYQTRLDPPPADPRVAHPPRQK